MPVNIFRKVLRQIRSVHFKMGDIWSKLNRILLRSPQLTYELLVSTQTKPEE